MKLRIGAKLGLGFLLMLLLVAAAGIASILTVSKMANLTSVMASESQEALYIGNIWENLVRADATLGKAVLTGTDGEIATAKFRQSELQKVVSAYLENLKFQQSNAATTPASMITSLETANHDYNLLFEMYIKIAEQRTTPNLLTFADNKSKALEPYLFTLAEMAKGANARMVAALAGIQSAQSTLIPIVIAVTIIAALLGAGLAYGITRSITLPIQRIVEVSDKISMGDLDTAIEVTSHDEIGDLQESVERMRISLKTALEMLKKKS